MRVVRLSEPDDFEGWRQAARALALNGIAPDAVRWQAEEAEEELFDEEASLPPPPPDAELTVSRRFLDLAQSVILHRDETRFARLYAFLLRLKGQPELIADAADPALIALEDMARAVRRDIHKMRAFLRFRSVTDEAGERFVAWYEPEHHIVRANARFFVDRFAGMRWSILTPEVSIHWDGETLTEGPGALRSDAPQDDAAEALWKTYYASIFNPARLKTGAMLKEMPRKYWRNMPETALVPGLIAGARAREEAMIDTVPQAVRNNADAALAALREEASACHRCPLWKPATQMVFGEGPADAALMLVGEQPGDQEDLQGRPFVGPAGQLLDRALAAAGIDRSRIYITNSVKHFKFTPRGGRRIHQKPDVAEIDACRWWVEQETMIVNPKLTVMLGATAARAILGRQVTIGRERGRALELPGGGTGWITVHPSFLLRIDDARRANEEKHRFLADLKGAAALTGLTG